MGNFFNIIQTNDFNETDIYEVGNAGIGYINLNSCRLSYKLPEFKTKSNTMPITISASYSPFSSGLLGKSFKMNFQYTINFDIRRVVLTDYTESNTYFISYDKEEAKSKLGIDTINKEGLLYVNLNDNSYMLINMSFSTDSYQVTSNSTLYLNNGLEITFASFGQSPAVAKILTIKNRVNNQINFEWNGKLLNRIVNDDNDVVTFSYNNNYISDIHLVKEHLHINCTYTIIYSDYYLEHFRIYNSDLPAQMFEKNILANVLFSHRSYGLTVLTSVKDIINNIHCYFYYPSDQWLPNVIQAGYHTGLQQYKTYNYNQEQNMCKITNQYEQSNDVFFDDLGKVKTITNTDNRYITYFYQKSNKGELTPYREAITSNSFNVLLNGDFEQVTNNKPDNWFFQDLQSQNIIVNNTYLPGILGNKMVRIPGHLGTQQVIYQNYPITGGEGDEWFFSAWGKANFTTNNKFIVRIYVNYPSISSEKEYNFSFNPLDNDYQIISGSIKCEHNYTNIRILVIYDGENECYIDNVKLYKHNSNVHYDFNKNGDIDSISLADDNFMYNYDEYKNIIKVKSSSGEIYELKYNGLNLPLHIKDLTCKKKIIYEYDSKGNKIKTQSSNNNEKIEEVENVFDNNNNLIESIDIDGFTSFNKYKNNLLVETLTPSGITNIYKYNESCDLINEQSHLNEKDDGCEYYYDTENRIIHVQTLNGTRYSFLCDEYERVIEIKMNNVTLFQMIYSEQVNNNKTSLITEKKYFSSSLFKYSFSYDSKHRLEYVKYNDVDKIRFIYGNDDQLLRTINYETNTTKYYFYNSNNDIIGISDNYGNEFKYIKDNKGNIQKNIYISNNINKTYDFDYQYENNEYNLKGYLSHLVRSSLDDCIISNELGELINGEKPQLKLFEMEYNETLKSNIIRLTKERSTVSFNNKDINSQRIDKKLYKSNYYDKEKWNKQFKSKKSIYAWIKLNGTFFEEQTIFSFGLELDCLYKLRINTSGELIFYNKTTTYNTNLNLTLNTWNFVSMSIQGSKATIVLNTEATEIDFIVNTELSTICSISIGEYVSFVAYTQYDLNRRPGNSLQTTVDVLFAGIGTSSLNYNKVYTEGLRYLNDYFISPSSGVNYINNYIYRGMDVISLNGSLVSSSGVEPREYSYTDNIYTIDKTRLFEYDNSLKRHVYGSYSKYINYNSQEKSFLSYDLLLQNIGTFTMFVKPSSDYISDNRTIFCFTDKISHTPIIKLYMDNDLNLWVTTNQYPNGITNNKKLKYNKWNFIALKLYNNTLIIKINEDSFIQYAKGTYDLSNSRLYIGSSINDNNVPINHIEWNIELFSYSTEILSDERINNIYESGRTISIKKEYDDDNRIIKKVIHTTNTISQTKYRYYENSNKINQRLTSEVIDDEKEIIYSYDESGNILQKLTMSIDGYMLEGESFEYDELKRIKKETKYLENYYFDYSYEYEYDNNSNITKKTRFISESEIDYIDMYEYSLEVKDILVLVKRIQNDNENTIFEFEYDNIAYPSKLTNQNIINNIIWEGKRLKSFGNYTYLYDENGIRISNKKNGKGFDYTVDGNKIISFRRTIEDESIIINYHFDECNQVCGFNYNGDEYFFIRDITGNINKIIDIDGTSLVKYDYSSYGVPSIIIPEGLSNEKTDISNIIASNNIYIYKGYCYDFETKMYYLNTRFYIPEIGRYLSIDDITNIQLESIGGLNLFAYCCCNPIMYFDPNGNMAISTIIILVCIGIGAIAGGAIVYTIAKNKGETGWALFCWTLLGIVGGGVIGGIIGYFAAPAIASFLTSTMSISIPTGFGLMTTEAGVATLVATGSATITISGSTILETIGLLSLGLTVVMFAKKSKLFGKETSSEKPSWVNSNQINLNQTPQQNANRILNDKYGINNWEKGPKSEFNQIVKWIQRWLKNYFG